MYFFGKSDIGKKRSTNQDAFGTFWLFDNCCLLMICDGMGGASGGNIASEIGVKFFSEHLRKRLNEYPVQDGCLILPWENGGFEETVGAMLQSAADRANTAIWNRAKEDERLKGMGTTLVALLCIDGRFFVLNIGDSRLYQIASGQIRRLTKDHSYLQYLLDSGQITPEQAEHAPIRNIITRSLGTEETVRGDLYLLSVREEEEGFLLLCSDGLYGYVPEEEIARTVCAWCEIHDVTEIDYELEDKADRLIELANEAGGGDNISVILLKYTRNGETP